MKDSEKAEDTKSVEAVKAVEDTKSVEAVEAVKTTDSVDVKKSSVKKTPIWDSIKNRKISLFSLPEDHLSKYVEFLNETPTALVATFKLPSLPSALEKYLSDMTIEVIDKNKIEIKRKV